MKGFVFDLDNTLFDRYATITKIIIDNYERIRPYINPAYDPEMAADHICHAESKYILAEGGWNAIYDALLRENFFHPDNIPERKKAFAFMLRAFEETSVNFSFTYELLTKIRDSGYKLGIITNGGCGLQNRKIDNLGFRDLFDVVVVSGEYALIMCGDEKNETYYKPDTGIFLYTAELLGEDPASLYYVGDNPINDVMGAKKAGYVPIWVSSRSPWPLDMASYPQNVVRTIGDLERFL